MEFSGSAEYQRRRYQDKSLQRTVGAADTTIAGLITCLNDKHTIHIQCIRFLVTTDAAVTWTFRDSAGTPIVLWVIPASVGVGLQRMDFVDSHGSRGFALTPGMNLDVAMSGAGYAGSLMIDAFMKPSATMIPSEV